MSGSTADRLAAQRAWQLALDLAEKLDPPQMQRRLARIRAALALQLHASQPERARVLAEAALRWYRTTGGYAQRISTLEPLLR